MKHIAFILAITMAGFLVMASLLLGCYSWLSSLPSSATFQSWGEFAVTGEEG
jgi:hypothetical protein